MRWHGKGLTHTTPHNLYELNGTFLPLGVQLHPAATQSSKQLRKVPEWGPPACSHENASDMLTQPVWGARQEFPSLKWRFIIAACRQAGLKWWWNKSLSQFANPVLSIFLSTHGPVKPVQQCSCVWLCVVIMMDVQRSKQRKMWWPSDWSHSVDSIWQFTAGEHEDTGYLLSSLKGRGILKGIMHSLMNLLGSSIIQTLSTLVF